MALFIVVAAQGADTFKVVSYNLKNYLDIEVPGRHPKPVEERDRIRKHIVAVQPDVIAFQEVGRESALLELRDSLKKDGLDLPYWAHTKGWDTNIFVAVLSKHPIKKVHERKPLTYLLNGKRLHMSRGVCDVEIEVDGKYQFSLMNVHLKSRRPVGIADEADMRLAEAKILRKLVDERLERSSDENLIVVGDFNDLKSTKPIREIVGRGNKKLKDLRPFERNGDNMPASNPRYDPLNVSWTYFYGRDDTYQRIDYMMVSPGMEKEWNADGSYVYAVANWGQASDHRPVVAEFVVGDR